MLHTSALACCALALAVLLPVPQDAKDKPAPAKPKVPEVVYPTFQPFTSARMFKLLVGDPQTIDFQEQREELAKMAEIQKKAKDAAEQAVGKPNGASALLVPEMDALSKAALPLVPAALMRLSALWDAKTWSAQQLKSATDVAEFLSTLPGGPHPAFGEGKPDENHAELVKLVRWFRSEVAKPEKYAAMIATVDDGPFCGLPYETKELLKPVQTQKLGEEIELRLCKVERPNEPYVLQAVRKDKLLWSRVLSGGPDESVVEAELRSKPIPLDEYGWKVCMTVRWSQGKESAYLYLDPEGGMLFYFLTW